MASINGEGNIRARCIGCDGALSAFLWKDEDGRSLGNVITTDFRRDPYHFYATVGRNFHIQWRLFRCASCGIGALGVIEMHDDRTPYPEGVKDLALFATESGEQLSLPETVPDEIRKEFREAERCLSVGCYRAAAALFRSVLDKVLRAHGYKPDRRVSLKQQIDQACEDGILTQSRKRRAHDEIRVLGNDVLHDEWAELSREDVEPAHRYAQRVLEDFYDDRASVLRQLQEAGRVLPESAFGES